MLFFLLTFLVFVTQYLIPYWWVAAIDAILAAMLVGKSARGSFFSGFFSVGLVWLSYAYWLDAQNERLLSKKIAQLIQVPSPTYLLIITALIGGLVGGFAALTGYSIKAMGNRKYK